MFAFLGPAYLISVGYMDPGNWATDLEGGARFGFSLLWVLLMSNLMAIVLQVLSARLGIVTGKDLAQACRERYPRYLSRSLWVLTEIAIAATDLAELLGTAIGLNLLFGLPLIPGVLLTAFDTFLFLGIQHLGMRRFEAFIMTIITVIGVCFIFELFLSGPNWGAVATGFLPRLPDGALYVAIGIIGATVMPHNLYLHSALVQSRSFDPTPDGKRQACRYNLVDAAVALNGAFFVNAAILILAATVFHQRGIVVTELQQAHHMISPLLGTSLAGIAFALALVLAGQASTLTGTLAGQIVMEGFLHFKIRPVLRRFITRALAIIPALAVLLTMGEQGTYRLLLFSQVVLSLQLSFAVLPLIQLTSDRTVMGEFTTPRWGQGGAWIIAALLLSLNAYLVIQTIGEWMHAMADPVLFWGLIVPGLGALAGLLLRILLDPVLRGRAVGPLVRDRLRHFMHGEDGGFEADPVSWRRVGVALTHEPQDHVVLSHAVSLARTHDARLVLLHVVEGATGDVYGQAAYDRETREDEEYLTTVASSLETRGFDVDTVLGYGAAPRELIRLVEESAVDVLVMAGHGHRGMGDLFFGSTITAVRHEVRIPILVVRRRE